MTLAEASEERLRARLRAGDETAFRELVARHDRAMKRTALTFVRTPSVADEVVQDTSVNEDIASLMGELATPAGSAGDAT